MERYVGLDVSQQFTHVCVVDDEGRISWQGSAAKSHGAMPLLNAREIQVAARGEHPKRSPALRRTRRRF